VNSDNDTNIRNKPELFEATATNYPVGSAGKEFKYVVAAFNAIGSTQSEPSSYILATIPSAPATAPQVVASLTSSTKITVTMTALVGDTATGGTTISGYGLQMSKNSPAEPAQFVDVVETPGDSVTLQHSTTAVAKGEYYAFRYRAKNEYGWSEGWSPEVYAVAADPPQAPPVP
jgi:hypothetical protein